MAIEILSGGEDLQENIEPQVEQPEGEMPEGEQPEGEGRQAADDEVVITIGDEKPPEEDEQQQAAPTWVKELRKSDREKAKRIRELEQQIAAKQQPDPAAEALGAKPTLEDCDFDADVFETRLTAWHDKKRAVEDKAAQQRKEQEAEQAAYQSKVEAYNTAKVALKVPDFDEAEAAIIGSFNQIQQAVLVKAKDAEKLVYAIGKSKTELAKLAAIKDPIDFALAIGALGTQLKVTPRKAPPAPERTVRSTSGASTPGDSHLDKLREEAVRTGDMTKLMAYKQQQRKTA